MATLKSHGVVLEMGDGATPTEAFTALSEVRDIDEVPVSRATEETTSHDSEGAEFIAVGVPDYGEISFTLPHAAAAPLRAKVVSGAVTNFKLKMPGASGVLETMTFAGIVTNYGVPFEVAGTQTASVTIRITGAPTFA